WTDTEQRAFEDLKRQLSAERTLAHYDASLPLLVYMDASREHGYGAIVHQV
ncbi:hypothetical protein BJ508DRAFT_198806, partial [Ascobolus immersus RN42]